MVKQTAVELLEKELADNLKVIILNNDYTLMEKIFAKAKAMEKKQIMKAVRAGFQEGYRYPEVTIVCEEQYYNETYNK